MKVKKLRIATRKSPLAIWQANSVKSALERIHSDLHIELVGMLTEADKFLETPLTKIGGKGLFVKELEMAILEHRADIAVHSIKDLPAEFPDGLTLAVIGKREDPRDVLVTADGKGLSSLSTGAKIGTSSLRRQCQLHTLRPDLNTEFLRGNVGTRIEKLDAGIYDGIILAAAGLQRLNMAERITEYFSTDVIIPAIGQGAIGIECRQDDADILQLIRPLDDMTTRFCITAERAVNQRLGGNCQVPVAAHAVLKDNQLHLHGMVGKPDGSLVLKNAQIGATENAYALGIALADDLLAQGAGKILAEINCG